MALITGATSGIGEAFAAALPPSTGLLLTGRNEEKLAALATRHAHGGRAVETLVADLALPEDRAELVERAQAAKIDLFVNNAGLGKFGPVVENDAEVEREIVSVNIVAVHELTRALVPGMIERARAADGRAGLVIVASVIAFLPVPMMATYAASKAFDLRFTEALAEELREQPIDVLALCPGATETDFPHRAGVPRSLYRHSETAAAVAGKALEALGRRAVLISPPLLRFAVAHQTALRRLMTVGAGRAMRRKWRKLSRR
jgi:hypothetical protein